MSRMVVIYSQPADPVAFDNHYFNTHVPLAKRLPGLIKYEVSRGPIRCVTGSPAPYVVGTLYFETMQAIEEAFSSDAGRACAADRRLFAPNSEDATILLFDEEAV